jgi:hypothetical protein
MFATLMYERHHTKIAVFGGKPGENMEFKGGFIVSTGYWRHYEQIHEA